MNITPKNIGFIWDAFKKDLPTTTITGNTVFTGNKNEYIEKYINTNDTSEETINFKNPAIQISIYSVKNPTKNIHKSISPKDSLPTTKSKTDSANNDSANIKKHNVKDSLRK